MRPEQADGAPWRVVADPSAPRRNTSPLRHVLPRSRAAGLTAVGALALLIVLVVAGLAASNHRPASTTPNVVATGVATNSVSSGAGVTAAPTGDALQCPAETIDVRDAATLEAALSRAKPGDSIRLHDGTYRGRFSATASGTVQQPIFLCGAVGAVLDGNGEKSGYGLHLDGANFWHLIGFTVQDVQKGVVLDHCQHVVIQAMTVRQIGDEGIHLRAFSSDNLVLGNTVTRTGQLKPQFGEGIYVGTAQSNWGQISGGQPDRSDRNIVRGNTISATAAESIDIKEGTTGGSIIGNTFDGSAISGANSAQSWVNVKGNGWLIKGNTGHNSILDGFKNREVVKGWGHGNTFTSNIADVNGPGYGFDIQPADTNRVSCDNTVTGAASGMSNIPCS
jgi:nitrous oxidase accessory protein NosD